MKLINTGDQASLFLPLSQQPYITMVCFKIILTDIKCYQVRLNILAIPRLDILSENLNGKL